MTNEQESSVAHTQVSAVGRRVLSVGEVAEMYGLNRATVYRAIDAGKLTAYRFGTKGGAIRVPITALADFEAAAVKAESA
ncbi:excisionase family DNA binding protein [Catenulispora sp. EB89]|uniref:helix-turn-helix domain-containing protein n=1 Tax=Catenulispora sp. EB89 TaxID=3156257 RepID=UPI003514770B